PRTGANTETQKPKQTQIPCACRAPLEETMEADNSIWRKTGHFYFALTRTELTNGTHLDSWEEELASDESLFGVVNHRLAGRAASEATHDRGTTARLRHPTPGIGNTRSPEPVNPRFLVQRPLPIHIPGQLMVQKRPSDS